MDKMYPRLDVRKFFSFDGYGLKLDKVAWISFLQNLFNYLNHLKFKFDLIQIIA
jgi:hypothetical protein